MKCKNCEKEFEPKSRGRRNPSFCCQRCADVWRIKINPKYENVCQHCGKTFRTHVKDQKYCSQECSHAARKTGRTIYNKNCLYCGKEFTTLYKKTNYCSPICGSMHQADKVRGQYYCEYCGKPRHSDHPNRNRFCSVECVRKARHEDSVKRIETIKFQKMIWKELNMKRACDYCGKTFIAYSSSNRFCSDECRYQNILKKEHEYNLSLFVSEERKCLHCGKIFYTKFRAQHQDYCSDKCREDERKDIRKEQMKKAFIEPVGLKFIYKKYNGKCGICGLPVPNTTESTNQWSATVDHIIPLSKGGLHKKSNCQLAHRMCNSIKLDTVDVFKIDWNTKMREEPGRWEEQFDDLKAQLKQRWYIEA